MGTEEAIIYSFDIATISSIIPAFANRKDVLVVDEVSWLVVSVSWWAVGEGWLMMLVLLVSVVSMFPPTQSFFLLFLLCSCVAALYSRAARSVVPHTHTTPLCTRARAHTAVQLPYPAGLHTYIP